MTQLLDHDADLVFGPDGSAAIHRRQNITTDYLTGLHEARLGSKHTAAPETYRVASIPVALVEHWQRQGFDVFREPAKAIVARLRTENLQAFLTTEKSI